MAWLDNALSGLGSMVWGKVSNPPPEVAPEKPVQENQAKPVKDTAELSKNPASQLLAYKPIEPQPAPLEVASAKPELKETRLKAQSGASAMKASAMSAVHSEAPIAEPHDYIYKKCLNEAQQKAFRELSPEDRDNFCKIFSTVGGNWDEQDAHAKESADSLRLLLENGSMNNVDANDKKLITTLGEACDRKLSPELQDVGLDKSGQLQQLIKQLAYPTAIYQGEGTSTCASSTVQTIMASTQPGEYARIASDLIFDGKAEVGDDRVGHQTIDLSFSELQKQDNGRSFFSKLIQGSFNDFATQFPKEGEEYAGRGGGGGTFKGETDKGGLSANQINNLYKSVVGNVPITMGVDKDNAAKAVSNLSEALKEGAFVPAGLNFDGQKHAVTVMGYDGENVTYCDSIDRQTIKMPLEDFKSKLEVLVLPEQFAKGTALSSNFSFDDLLSQWGGRGGGGGSSR